MHPLLNYSTHLLLMTTIYLLLLDIFLGNDILVYTCRLPLFAGDHNWFQFNTSAGTKVIEGNTKDGSPCTPGVADGLK